MVSLKLAEGLLPVALLLGTVPALAQDASERVSGDTHEALATVAVAAVGQAAELPAEHKDESSRSKNRLIEEIIVTAQKRKESIQDVPIAIAAFSNEKLEALGIQSAQDLERVTPGLTMTIAAGYNVAYLRGVGTDAFLPGADPSVPFYLDGVALLGLQGSSDTLGRVERVEVLKGPQGTLFGRNATGGAVNIVTPVPDAQFSGEATVTIGNYNTRNAVAYVNVPIYDGLYAALSGFSLSQNNFYKNDAGPIEDVFARGARAKVLWEIVDGVALTLAGSYQKTQNNSGLAFENTRVAPVFAAVLPEDPKADRHYSFDSLSGAHANAYLLSATLDWELPWVDLKIIGSEQQLKSPFVNTDFDKSALPIVNITSIDQRADQKTAEIQILSNDETVFSDRLEWVAGLFYLDSSGGFMPIAVDVAKDALIALDIPGGVPLTNTINDLLVGAGLPPLASGVRLTNYGLITSTAMSAYVQGTYSVSDALDLTVGARYQDEKRRLLGSRTTVLYGTELETTLLSDQNLPELHAKQLSPRVTLQWRPFDSGSQVYASWARAFKSPTYNTVNLLAYPGSNPPVKAERVDSFEMGLKSDLFDNSLRFNAAAFYIRQKDLLTGFVALLQGGIVSYSNAPGARIIGAEADALWTPMPDLNPGLAITGVVSVLDAEYTDYPNGKGFDTATGIAFGPDEPLPARDFKGNDIVRTPELTYSVGINQLIQVPGRSLEIGADANYSSGFYFLPQNSDLYARDSYTLFNARLSYTYEAWGVQLSAFCNNLSGVDYNETVFVDDFGRNQILNAPRTYGARAKWTF